MTGLTPGSPGTEMPYSTSVPMMRRTVMASNLVRQDQCHESRTSDVCDRHRRWPVQASAQGLAAVGDRAPEVARPPAQRVVVHRPRSAGPGLQDRSVRRLVLGCGHLAAELAVA